MNFWQRRKTAVIVVLWLEAGEEKPLGLEHSIMTGNMHTHGSWAEPMRSVPHFAPWLITLCSLALAYTRYFMKLWKPGFDDILFCSNY